MARTTQEVFDSHIGAIDAGDLETLMGDYADDAVLVTFDGTFTGKEAVVAFFQNAFGQFPNLKFSYDQTVVTGDTVLVGWSATSDVGTGRGGDTFIIQDGKIQRQTVWFEVFPYE